MKPYLLLAAMMFILIAGFGCGANQAFAQHTTTNNILELVYPTLSLYRPVTSNGRLYFEVPAAEKFTINHQFLFTIHENGLRWEALPYGGMVKITSPSRGTANADEIIGVNFSINSPGQQPGIESCRIELRLLDDAGVRLIESLEFDIDINAVQRNFVIAQPELFFKTLNGGFPNIQQTQHINLNTVVNYSVNWTATTYDNWLTLDKVSGTTPATIKVSLNEKVASLTPGLRYASIDVTTSDGTQTILVYFTLEGISLRSGGTLQLGTSRTSPNGQYKLTMQVDGNLVFSRVSDNFVMWASGTYGQGANQCIMQADGNLVIYNEGGQPLWASVTDGNPGAFLKVTDDGTVTIFKSALNLTPIWSTTALCSGRTLQSGGILRSGNGLFKLEMQADGNLALRNSVDRIVWATNTYNNPGSRVEMQVDGNLVIRTPSDQIIWASNTYTTSTINNNGSTLQVRGDGSLTIYRPDNTAIWNRGKGRLY